MNEPLYTAAIAVRSRAKTPLYYYIGLLITVQLIIQGVASNFKDDAEQKNYLANPQVYDFYIYMINEQQEDIDGYKYGTAMISAIEDDTVFFEDIAYYYAHVYSIHTDIKNGFKVGTVENVSDIVPESIWGDTFEFTRKELSDLFKKGEMISIYRPDNSSEILLPNKNKLEP